VSIAGSAALIIIGAILRFAVSWTPRYVDIRSVGVILMIGGLVGLAVAVATMLMRRQARAGAQVYEERRYTEPQL
jgi:O-antigen ligase